MIDKKQLCFDVSVYGTLEKYTETISKARCRIFYKYENRNGTYITDEFAEKLQSTLPYTPIKGIYEREESGDYTDHGAARSEGRIYGIVPENPNAEWETHLDSDGISREYLCTDVLIFTALYEEASEIIGKSQSMEIYEPSMKGSWEFINGRRYFVFTEGSFLGLQILGDEVEPCFEGAAFYTLVNSSIKELMQAIKDYELKIVEKDKGGQNMPTVNFKLSDAEKYSALWSLLNPNYTAESDWVLDYGICDVYDEYAVVKNYSNGNFERVYYTKENDEVVLGEFTVCYIVDVTSEEKTALETIQKLNGSFTKAEEELGKILEIKEENSTFKQRKDELEAQVSELENNNATYSKQVEELTADKETLTQELETLKDYKLNVETKEKEDIIAKYSEQLSAEVLDNYSNNLVEYTASDLEKNLAFELVNSNPNLFAKNDGLGLIPKNSEPKSGIERLLDKYQK